MCRISKFFNFFTLVTKSPVKHVSTVSSGSSFAAFLRNLIETVFVSRRGGIQQACESERPSHTLSIFVHNDLSAQILYKCRLHLQKGSKLQKPCSHSPDEARGNRQLLTGSIVLGRRCSNSAAPSLELHPVTYLRSDPNPQLFRQQLHSLFHLSC